MRKTVSLQGIKTVLKKLGGNEEPGEIEIDEGHKHTTYSYQLKGKEAFSFGLPRGTKAKSGTFWYVPEQMGLKNKEYRLFHDCPMSKKDLNKKLIDSGMV